MYTQSAGAIELNRAYGPLLINDASEVVAISGSGLNYGAYVSSGGTGAWTSIGSLGGPQTYPEGINGLGEIVGEATTSASSQYQAFKYSGGTMTELADVFGGGSASAYGINDQGVVVGGASLPDGSGHAFIEFPGGPMEDLNNFIDPSLGWTLGQAYAINDRGQILVAANDAAGHDRTVLLTPTPEPPSLFIALAAGLVLVLTNIAHRVQ